MEAIWLSEDAAATLVCEAERTLPNETGGLLLGYIARRDTVPVILEATTAGPLAVSTPYSYEPDQEYDVQIALARHRHSKGTVRYLGDWHSHAHGASYLSVRDRRVLKDLGRSAGAQLKSPVMLVVGGFPRAVICAWAWAPLSVLPFVRRMRSISLRTFEPDTRYVDG